MVKDQFLAEVERRLTKMFTLSKEGYRAAPEDRHRLEGFMQAGVFMQLTSNAELARLMDQVHRSVFGTTIKERQADSAECWTELTTDYSQYEGPSYERKNI